MTHAASAIHRKCIDALPEAPIKITDGLIIVDYDIDESMMGRLFVSLWGRRLELHSTSGGVFEGRIFSAFVDLGPMGAFFLDQVCITIERRHAQDAIDFDISGRGRLELRGLYACGSNPIMVQGKFRAVHSEATGERYLRLDLQPARISLPIVAGVVISVMPERLFFLAEDAGTIEMEMRANCSVAGLPHFVQNALGNDAISLDVRITPDGLSLHAATVHDRLVLDMPPLAAVGPLPELRLGELVASIRNLHIEVGAQMVCRVDVALQVPHVFHDFAEPLFSVRIRVDANGVEIRLLSSPLRALMARPSARESLDAHVDLGRYGAISFALPVLRLDATTGSLVAEGRISYEDLRIPLEPLIAFLDQAGMQRIAERLPESIAIQPFGWTGFAATLTSLVKQALGDGVIVEKAYQELNSLVEKIDRLPKHLREDFLRIEPPTELAFHIEVTSDLGARIHLSPAASLTKSRPMRLLVALLGPSGPELIGVSLHHLALSTIRAGQLFTVDVDADVHRFPLLPIALSMTMAKDGMFATADELSTRLSLRNVLAVLSLAGATPILIPAFFDAIEVEDERLDGLGLAGRWSFPRPKIDVTALLGTFARFKNDIMPGQTLEVPIHVHAEAAAGPFWIRLPRYLGGARIDVERATTTLEEPRGWRAFVAALQRIDVDALLGMIPFPQDGYPIELYLGPSFRKASRQWAKVAEPALLISAISTDEDLAETKMAGKLRALTGRVMDELAAMGKNSGDVRVEARIMRVTSTGIEVIVTLPMQSEGSSVQHRIDLQWDNFVGSTMKLAAMLGSEVR